MVVSILTKQVLKVTVNNTETHIEKCW